VIVPPTSESLARIAEVIATGGVIAFRTDTFYGVGADPFNPSAIRRIKTLKGREENKPILVIISDRAQVERLIDNPTEAFELLAETFWPGSLTLVGEARPDVPVELTAGTGTVGVRLPDDDKVRALVEACGGALTATSANLSGQAAAGNASQVQEYFDARVDLIVDDGEARTGRPSTVVDMSAAEPKLIREGVVAWAEIEKELSKRFSST
jgi:L-threonylcarbamoyladenylate synthase